MTAPDPFLANLPEITDFTAVAEPDRYRPLPEGWALAIADIVNSTSAIAEGRYKAVNMAGAAVISAVLNGTGRNDLPFVFGGDGAAVAVPPDCLAAAAQALAAVRRWAADEFGFDLRAALVPLADIRAAGHDLRVARFRASDFVSFAMFAGGGSSWAEHELKAGRYGIEIAPQGAHPDLTGLSCRWSPIRASHGQIVSIIVVPGAGGADAHFGALVTDVVRLAGETERGGHPLPVEGPPLRLSLRGIGNELRTRAGALRQVLTLGTGLGGTLLLMLLHRFGLSMGRFDARQYVRDTALNADFRKFDDGLKMTLDIDDAHLARIEARLVEAEAQGICRYGIHRQDSALVTCLVPSPLSRDHMHFVDGGSGGYATAARHLKALPVAET